MLKSVQTAGIATIFTGLSLFTWREGYSYSDWAVLALLPLSIVIFSGFWPLMLQPWRARLHVMLRDDSPLGDFLTGRIRAAFLSAAFTVTAVTLLAWQAWVMPKSVLLGLAAAFFISAVLFTEAQNYLVIHFHQPFARSIATSITTWLVAIPCTIIIAFTTWNWTKMPGSVLNATLYDAVQHGLAQLPNRSGWITYTLSLPSGYEAAKIWMVVQLRDYPSIGVLFSLDAALFSFILCRSAVIISQFTSSNTSNVKNVEK